MFIVCGLSFVDWDFCLGKVTDWGLRELLNQGNFGILLSGNWGIGVELLVYKLVFVFLNAQSHGPLAFPFK